MLTIRTDTAQECIWLEISRPELARPVVEVLTRDEAYDLIRQITVASEEIERHGVVNCQSAEEDDDTYATFGYQDGKRIAVLHAVDDQDGRAVVFLSPTEAWRLSDELLRQAALADMSAEEHAAENARLRDAAKRQFPQYFEDDK